MVVIFSDAKLRNNQLQAKNYSQGCEQIREWHGRSVLLYLPVPAKKEVRGKMYGVRLPGFGITIN